ncbi:MAG TPA: MBL fold metallo-hydrolase [Terriglobales bacterium]|nr:MBL fold metallo-hydrolase [Terriglobales bacterium]
MIHEVIPVGPLQCNCSIIGDEATREAIVVDPGDNIGAIIQIITQHQLTVKHIVITHGHIDHIGGAMKLKATTGAPIHMNAGDDMQVKLLSVQAAWVGMESPGKVVIDQHTKDADQIKVGAIEATILHTPGHTEGSSCLYFPQEQTLVAGDTLFASSIGRTDLPGGNFDKIIASLHGKLMALPDEVTVIPGHGPATTIGDERETNPFITDKRYKPKLQEG